jgi:hypothetical protein
MKDKKKLHKLKYSMSNVRLPFEVLYNKESISIFLEGKKVESKEIVEGGVKKYGSYFKKYGVHMNNIIILSEELGIEDEELKKMWLEVLKDKDELSKKYTLKPQKEGRDNKGVYVGSGRGGYRGNTVRLPSKKRSKRTWNIFYKMFPHLDQRDKLD